MMKNTVGSGIVPQITPQGGAEGNLTRRSSRISSHIPQVSDLTSRLLAFPIYHKVEKDEGCPTKGL